MEELDCNCSVETLLLRRRIDISLLRLGAWKRGMNYTTQLYIYPPYFRSRVHIFIGFTRKLRMIVSLNSWRAAVPGDTVHCWWMANGESVSTGCDNRVWWSRELSGTRFSGDLRCWPATISDRRL